jgi:Flp pilus assembly pilin Flp
MFQRLWRDQVGASLIEYSILAALITVIVVVAMSVAGSWIQGMRALVAPAGLSPSVLLCSTGIHRAIVIAAQRAFMGVFHVARPSRMRDSQVTDCDVRSSPTGTTGTVERGFPGRNLRIRPDRS